MDLQIIYLTSIFTLPIFVYILHKILTNKSNSSQKLPPGPWKLPIIGNIHNLIGSLPHHCLRDLSSKYGPLMHLKLGEVSTIVISSPEYAKEVMKTHDINFSSRPEILAVKIMNNNALGIAFAPYGDYWRQLRKISTLELLSSKCVQSFKPVREEELVNLMKLIGSKEGSEVNLTKEVFLAISSIVSRIAFGKKFEEQQKFISVVKEIAEVAGGFDLGDLYPSAKWLQHISGMKPKLEKLQKQSDRIMQKIINEHRDVKSRSNEEIGEDLVDVLLKQDSLSDNSVKAVILDIFGGGTETSATTIIWAMSEMIKNPTTMEKAQAEVREVFSKEGKPNESDIDKLTYLKCVVKETLRLHPPAPLLLPRECAQACDINGYHIPSKSKIIVNAWAIGRDPKHWTNAEKFYPERFIESSIDFKGNNFEFIPFGAGRRMCPGITFGLINVEFPLALLMFHFDWKLPNGMRNEDFDMTELFGSAVPRKYDLNLIPITYHHP